MAKISDEFIFVKDFVNNEKFSIKNNTPLMNNNKDYKKTYNIISWVKENSQMNMQMNEKTRQISYAYTSNTNQIVVNTSQNANERVFTNRFSSTTNGENLYKKFGAKNFLKEEDTSKEKNDCIFGLKNVFNKNNIYEKLHQNISKNNSQNFNNNNSIDNTNYCNKNSNITNKNVNDNNNVYNNTNNENNNSKNPCYYDMLSYKKSLTGLPGGLESYGRDVNDQISLRVDSSEKQFNYKDYNMKMNTKVDDFCVSEFLSFYHNSKKSISKKTKVIVCLQSVNQTQSAKTIATKTTTEVNFITPSPQAFYIYKVDSSKKNLIIHSYEAFLKHSNGDNDGNKLVGKALGFDNVFSENTLQMCLENCVDVLKEFMNEKPVCMVLCDDDQNSEDSLFIDLKAKKGFNKTDLINNNIHNLKNNNSDFDLIFYCLKWLTALIQLDNSNSDSPLTTAEIPKVSNQRNANIEFNVCAIVFDMKNNSYEKVFFEEEENKLGSCDTSKLMFLQKSLKQKLQNKNYILNINVRAENTSAKGFDMINTLTFVKVTSTLPENTEHLNTSSDNNVYSGFNGNTHLDTNLQQVLSLMAGKKPRENNKVDKLLLKYLSSTKKNCHCSLLIKMKRYKTLGGYNQNCLIEKQKEGLYSAMTLHQYRLLTAASRVYRRRLRKATYNTSAQSSDSETSSVMLSSTGSRNKKTRGKVMMGTKQYKTKEDFRNRHSKIYGIKDSSKYERLLMEKRLSYEDPTVLSRKTPFQENSFNNTISNDSCFNSKHLMKPMNVSNEVWVDGPGTGTLMNCDVEEELDELHKICTSMNCNFLKKDVTHVLNKELNVDSKVEHNVLNGTTDNHGNTQQNLRNNFSNDFSCFNNVNNIMKETMAENPKKKSVNESFCDPKYNVLMTSNLTKQTTKNSLKSFKLEANSKKSYEEDNLEKFTEKKSININVKNCQRTTELEIPKYQYEKSEIKWRDNSKTLDPKELSFGKQNCTTSIRDYHTNSLKPIKSKSSINKPHVLTRFSLSSLFSEVNKDTVDKKDNNKTNKISEVSQQETSQIKKLDIIPEDEYYEEKLEQILEVKENNDNHSNNNTINDKMKSFLKHYTENFSLNNDKQKICQKEKKFVELKSQKSEISDTDKKTCLEKSLVSSVKRLESQSNELKLFTNEKPLGTVPLCKPLSLSLLSKPIFFTPQMNRACVSNQFTKNHSSHETRLYEPLPPIKHIMSFNDVQNIFPTPPDTPGSNDLTLSTLFNTSNEKNHSFIKSNIASNSPQAPTSPLNSTDWSLVTQHRSQNYIRSTSLNENYLNQQDQLVHNNFIVKPTKQNNSPMFRSLRRSWLFKIFKKSKKNQIENDKEILKQENVDKVTSSAYNLTHGKCSHNNLQYHFNNKIDSVKNFSDNLSGSQNNRKKYFANYDSKNVIVNETNGLDLPPSVSYRTPMYSTEMKHLQLLDMYTEQCNLHTFKDTKEENKSRDLPDFIINMNNSYSNAFIEDINSSYVDVSALSKKDNDSYTSMKNYLDTPSLQTSTPKSKKLNENYDHIETSYRNSHYKNRHTKIYKSNFLNISHDNILKENSPVLNRNSNDLLSNSFHGSEHFKNYPINEFCSNNLEKNEKLFQFSIAPTTPSTPKPFAKKTATKPTTPRMLKLELKQISNQIAPPSHFMSNHISSYPLFNNDSNKNLHQPLKKPGFLNYRYDKQRPNESYQGTSHVVNNAENKNENKPNYGYRSDNVINLIDKNKLDKMKYNERNFKNSIDRKQKTQRNTLNPFYSNDTQLVRIKGLMTHDDARNQRGNMPCRIDSDTESGVASVANVTCLKVLKTSKKKSHKDSMSYYSFSRISSSEEDLDDYESLKTYQK